MDMFLLYVEKKVFLCKIQEALKTETVTCFEIYDKLNKPGIR